MATQTDPFAAMGGGVQLPNGGWVPKNHPLAQQYLAQQSQQQTTAPGAAPTAPAATNVQQQAANAQTYSATPGAAPTAYTTNQGTQDVIRNTYLQRAMQGTTIDARTDPNIRQQSDAFAAAMERARRDAVADAAERNFAQGLASSGAATAEQRLINERAAQARGSFEAELVARELANRRDEIREALGALTGLLTADQEAALRRELAELEAQLQRAGIASSEKLAARELDLKRTLGLKGLDLDRLRIELQNQQFNKQLGFNIADREAFWNNAALQALLG